MKKSIIFVAALAVAVAANASEVSKKVKAPKPATYSVSTKNYDAEGAVNTTAVDAFSVAEINIPARIRVIEGNSYGVNVVTLNDATEKSLRYSVKNGVLRVYSTSFDEVENNKVVINLVVPVAPEIKTSANLDMINVR